MLPGVEHCKGRGKPVEAPEARLKARLRLDGVTLGFVGLLQKPAQRGDLLFELPVPGGEIGKLEPLPSKVAHLEHDGAPGGAAVGLDISVAAREQHQVEGLAPLGQRIDRIVERLGRSCVEPCGETEELAGIARHAERGWQGRDQKLRLAGLRHGQERLRLCREQRVERALAEAVALSLDLGFGLGLARPFRGAEAGNRGPHGKGDDAEIDAERQQRAGIERGAARRHGRAEWKQREWNGQGDDAEQHLWPP